MNDSSIRALIDRAYQRLAGRVIHRLRRFKQEIEGTPPARHVWDFWMLEIQHEHSIAHFAIESIVDSDIDQVVRALDPEQVLLLFQATEEAEDEDENGFDANYYEREPGDSERSAVARMLRECVDTEAANGRLGSELEKMLEEQALDRFERDREG